MDGWYPYNLPKLLGRHLLKAFGTPGESFGAVSVPHQHKIPQRQPITGARSKKIPKPPPMTDDWRPKSSSRQLLPIDRRELIGLAI